MKYATYKKSTSSGFTLIETMIAVFLLTVTFSVLLTLNAQSIFSARYATNEITASYMLQETVDFIRNDRDTTAFLNNGTSGGGWVGFLNHYGYNNGSVPNLCFATFTSTGGCYFEPAAAAIPTPTVCNTSPAFGTSKCPVLYSDPQANYNDFYTYNATDPSGTAFAASNFKRQVLMMVNPTNADELDVKVVIEWRNGSLLRSRSLQVAFLDWQK